MDLVQLAEAVAKSPFGLPIFLFAVVWWTTTVIKQKDKYIEDRTREELQKAEVREKWYQKYVESTTTHIINIENDVRDMWEILREGRVHFESSNRDDETSSNPTHDDGGLNHLRSKLSAGRKAK
jgi:hypothetical protein